ncbi:MAG: phytanoyl-CoA dioxygenase family protein [Chloroflexota bacterium]
MPNILNQEQIQFYNEHGYLHARGIIPADLLAVIQTVLARWVDQTIAGWIDKGLLTDPLTELDFHHRLVRAWHEAERPTYIRSPRRDLVSPEMYNILVHPTLLSLASDLLATPDISVHGVFNARPKLPDQLWTRTPWHQDAQYYQGGKDAHIVSMWIPLQPVTEANSCLQVAPGQHHGPLHERYHDKETGFIGVAPEVSEELEGVTIEMAPGDVLCFPQRTPHRATANRSDAVRWSMDVRYEPTALATPKGKPQGFIARSQTEPNVPISYASWLEQWADIPLGSY